MILRNDIYSKFMFDNTTTTTTIFINIYYNKLYIDILFILKMNYVIKSILKKIFTQFLYIDDKGLDI